MPSGPMCHCSLCRTETQLMAEITAATGAYEALVSSTDNGLRAFPSAPVLLSYLRASSAGPHSDQILGDLLRALPINPPFVETLMVIAFLPMLHRTVRLAVRQQAWISLDDAAQQALGFFLQFLGSKELQVRQSHLAFAISRAVKRQMFEWATRERTQVRPEAKEMAETLALSASEQPMERYTTLKHFLDRCVARGWLSDPEVELLIRCKLDGRSAEEIARANSTSSNALRQKMKRLLAKLRRFARGRAHEHRPPANTSIS